MDYIVRFTDSKATDISLVGGKNASLSNMIIDLADKVHIPNGFAITVKGYWYFLESNDLVPFIHDTIALVDGTNANVLKTSAAAIRHAILGGKWPKALQDEIRVAYQELAQQYNKIDLSVAVRSSATAEDLPTASFAGQQESFLYVVGEADLLDAVKKCMASLFTDRAIFYRMQQNIDHMKVALSVGVQKMVQSDKASSGVAFSLDTESGFKDVVMINGSWGLGELVVKGRITPDEFIVCKSTLKKGYKPIIKKALGKKDNKLIYDAQNHSVHKISSSVHEQNHFCLSDEEILQLSRDVMVIEDYYSTKYNRWVAQDVEWAKDGTDNRMYIVQARPETVYSVKTEGGLIVERYLLTGKQPTVILQGLSVGQKIVSGTVRIITSVHDADTINDGEIVVAQMTDPDWVPVMKRATAIITDHGGRTCHAAIVSRELDIPALVGTGNATTTLVNGQKITINCSQGEDGYVYEGIIPYTKEVTHLEQLPAAPVALMLNIAEPSMAFTASKLPVQGVGLARIEFILSNYIGVHPMAILELDKVDPQVRDEIIKRASAYVDVKTFYIEKLAQGIGMIAAAFYPRPVMVRLSDLKTSEYHNLLGGSQFEPIEQNPMIGWRGAARFDHQEYQHAFALECAAFKMARKVMGFDNIAIMIPFVRTVDEAKRVIEIIQGHGLSRHDGVKLILTLEVPSNALLIDQFTPLFDGFSIGSNDLTQLTLGIDRDSELMAHLFDERNEAVKKMIKMSVDGAHAAHLPIGICGQAPSDYPDFADYLISIGIDSISLNADAVIPFLTRS